MVSNFALTTDGEPICLLEYATEIASFSGVHVLFMQDWDPTKNSKLGQVHLKEGANPYEKVLAERPGQEDISIFNNVLMTQFNSYFKDARLKEGRDIFQFPFHMKEAGIELYALNVQRTDEFMIDMRSEEKKEKIRKNRPLTTLKLSLDNFAERPRLQHSIVTTNAWKPSVYLMKKLGKVMLILDGNEEGTIALNFHDDAAPYKLEH